MIGEKIKNRRKEIGLTQEELVKEAYKKFEKDTNGEKIKIFDQAQLSKWENGEQIPNARNLWLLSMLLDISFFELNVEEDNKIIENFYHSGYDLAQKIGENLNTTIYKLLELAKNKKITEINQEILELYIYNKIEMPEDIAIMIPIYSANKEQGEEKYISYIQAFISGLNNGSLKK